MIPKTTYTERRKTGIKPIGVEVYSHLLRTIQPEHPEVPAGGDQ